MMVRFASIAWVALIALACAAPVYADNPVCVFAHTIGRDWNRNNCWPEPFICPDRQAARSPFVTMVQNGWRRQNLLGAFHFEMDSGDLTPAGTEKLQWILTEAPEYHRTVYVGRGATAAETALRVSAIQKTAHRLLPDSPPPAIVETNITPQGWPAERIDAIGRKFQDTTPAPRLPTADKSSEQQ